LATEISSLLRLNIAPCTGCRQKDDLEDKVFKAESEYRVVSEKLTETDRNLANQQNAVPSLYVLCSSILVLLQY